MFWFSFSTLVCLFIYHTIATRYTGSVTTPIDGDFRLNEDDYIYYDSYDTYLTMTSSGSLSLYNPNLLWWSDTAEGSYASITSDGNIQIRGSSDEIVWQTNNDNSATQPHTLHITTDCASLVDSESTILWSVGCCTTSTTTPTTTHPTQDASYAFINDECIPIDGVSWVNQYQIAWIKVVSCVEITNIFTYYYNKTIIFDELASSAISIKIAPNISVSNHDYDDYAVMTVPYSNPVYALRDNVELSFVYDQDTGNISSIEANLSNWIGNTCFATAKLSHITHECINPTLLPASETLYRACSNNKGLNIQFDERCDWSFKDVTGHDMEIYFGFEFIDCAMNHVATTEEDVGEKSSNVPYDTLWIWIVIVITVSLCCCISGCIYIKKRKSGHRQYFGSISSL